MWFINSSGASLSLFTSARTMIQYSIPGSHVTSFAYGRLYYAFVFDSSEVVVYKPSTKKPTCKFNFEKDFRKTQCKFTSVIVVEKSIYVGLSDGRIFSFFRDQTTHRYTFTDSETSGLHNFELSGFVKAQAPVHLLGGSKGMLAYHTLGSDIYFLSRLQAPRSYSLNGPVAIYRFDSHRGRILLATKANKKFYVYRIKPVWQSKRKVRSKTKLVRNKADHELVAISKNGDIALFDGVDGYFHIYNPFHTDKLPKGIRIGNSDNTDGPCCFVGDNDDYFVYCGEYYAEIAVAVRAWDTGKWDELGSIDGEDLYKISDWQFEDDDSPIRDPGTDGKRLVVRVVAEDGENNKGLLAFDADGEDGVQLW